MRVRKHKKLGLGTRTPHTLIRRLACGLGSLSLTWPHRGSSSPPRCERICYRHNPMSLERWPLRVDDMHKPGGVLVCVCVPPVRAVRSDVGAERSTPCLSPPCIMSWPCRPLFPRLGASPASRGRGKADGRLGNDRAGAMPHRCQNGALPETSCPPNLTSRACVCVAMRSLFLSGVFNLVICRTRPRAFDLGRAILVLCSELLLGVFYDEVVPQNVEKSSWSSQMSED